MGRKRIDTNCLECGETFRPLAYEVSRGRGKYCSQKCSRPKGERHHLYKGVSRNETMKKYKEKFPERRKAQLAVSYALRKGRISKSECEKCGNQKAEAHHEDYNKPLEIMWLCRKHHIEQDRKLGTRTGDFK